MRARACECVLRTCLCVCACLCVRARLSVCVYACARAWLVCDRPPTSHDDEEDDDDDEDEDEVSPLAPRSTNPKPSLSCFIKTTVFCSATQSLWRK